MHDKLQFKHKQDNRQAESACPMNLKPKLSLLVLELDFDFKKHDKNLFVRTYTFHFSSLCFT